jgi:dipeptidyl aminopeptidase/acylaminoacyl peptidase
MTSTEFDRQLQEWLVSQAPAGWRAPDGLLASVTAKVDHIAQRPSWLARASAGALGAGADARTLPTMQGALLLLKLALIVALAAAVAGAMILLMREDPPRGELGYSSVSRPLEPLQTELYRLAPDGRNGRLVVTDRMFDCPATTPDGSVLAWWPSGPPSALSTLTYESGEWLKREHPGIRSELGWPPAIAPDGTKVAFDAGRAGDGQVLANLYMASLNDDEDPRLVSDELTGVRELAWSPDGSRIALVGSYIDGGRERQGLVVVTPEGPDVTLLASVDPRTGGVWMLSWSPDGKSIVYSRSSGVDSPADLYVVTVDGSGERQLTTNGTAPAWSPDATQIAFLIWSDGAHRLAVIEADGTSRRIISGPLHARFAWAPDGSALVIAAGDDPGGLLVIETAGNGETKRVDPSPPPQSRGCVYWWADLPTQP